MDFTLRCLTLAAYKSLRQFPISNHTLLHCKSLPLCRFDQKGRKLAIILEEINSSSMAGPMPSELDRKYLLLSACFPGIQTRKLTQKRYLEKKEEIRRTLKSGLTRKCSLPDLPTPAAVPKVCRLPYRSLGEDPLEHSYFRRLPRPVNASVDLTSLQPEQPSVIRLKPSLSTLWSRKLSTVQKKLRDIDHVRVNVRRTL